MNVSMQFLGTEQVQRKLTPDTYLPSVRDLLRDASIYATREAQREAGRDLGAIAQSIGAVVTPMSVTVSSRHPGAVAAEFGRRAGTPPPPASALRDWAARHGLSGLEFVLARAIGQRGIKGRFFMRRARERLQQIEMPRLLSKAASEIERKWNS